MSNDKRVEEISKKLTVRLDYSTDMPRTKAKKVKPDISDLKKLSRSFRKSLEDYSIEIAAYTIPRSNVK